MASVNSRAELVPNRAYSPTGSDDLMMDDDPEIQARMPLKPRPRHHSSYENMNDRCFTDDSSHQYEDPAKLANEVFHSQNRGRPALPVPSNNNKRPRKKENEAYEPVSSKQRKRTYTDESDSSGGYHRDTCSKLFKGMAFTGFLFALAALAVVVLLMLGMLTIPSCRDCKKELVPGQTIGSSGAQAVGSIQELWNVVKELRSSVSELNASVKMKDEIISQLQKRDLEHTNKIAELERKASHKVLVVNDTKFNFSSLVGPRGQPGIDGAPGTKGLDGLDGKPGKPGPGNMSLCRYMKEESVLFTAEASNGQNVIVREQRGSRIIGVTCSTLGTSEYNLVSQLDASNMRQYKCQCRGRSSVFPAGTGRALCIVHYWICPIIS